MTLCRAMMSASLLLYDHPLNERIRLLLRLEGLFNHARDQLKTKVETSGFSALKTLLEILELIERQDIKLELQKELERFDNHLHRLENSRHIDESQLHHVMEQIYFWVDAIGRQPTKLAHCLNDYTLINMLRKRLANQQGNCDLPLLNYWCHQSLATQERDLQAWFGHLEVLESTTRFILQLARECGHTSTVLTEKGYYHRSLDHHHYYPLLRVGLPQTTPLIPEISSGRHRFNLRLLSASSQERPEAVEEAIEVTLILCTI